MCGPAAPYIISAVGAAMSYKAQSDAAKERKKILQQGEDKNDIYNKQIIETIDKNSEQYDPNARAVANDEARTAAGESLTSYLTAARDSGMGEINETTQGKVSNIYDIDKAKRTVKQAEQAKTIARLMGNVRGANDLRINEGYVNADATSQIGNLASHQLNMARSNGIDVGNVSADPILTAAGAGVSGAGSGAAYSGTTNTVATNKGSPRLNNSYFNKYYSRSNRA